MKLIDGLVLTRHFEGDDHWLEVEHAEPRAKFAAALLRRMRRGDTGWQVTLDGVGIGAILHIRARGRTLIYKLTEYDDERDVFTGIWPD